MRDLLKESPPPPNGKTRHGPELTLMAFSRIAKIAHREAGLSIPDGKAAMVKTRLARRLRALRLSTYEEYCDLIESEASSTEMNHLISALTTNVSQFFREPHHFELFAKEIVPCLKARKKSDEIGRIWSAGCSNGQEPYSIAITLLEHGLTAQDVRILATDIDPVVVATARTGNYPGQMLIGIQDEVSANHFSETPSGDWKINPEARKMVSFNCMNLLDTWPMAQQFDAIFCRNVVIYFDKETQSLLWERFADALKYKGVLHLGHSERIDQKAESLYNKAGVTSYRRKSTPPPIKRKGI